MRGWEQVVWGFEVDAIWVEEVEEVAASIALWLGFGAEWGDVECAIEVF